MKKHLYFLANKRKKNKKKKKFINPNHYYDGNTLGIIRKNMASCFQHHPERQCLERERRHKYRLKNANIADLLAHTKKNQIAPNTY